MSPCLSRSCRAHVCCGTGTLLGEALDIDLGDFINRLYAILPQLALMPDIEAPPPSQARTSVRGPPPPSTADVLFRALHLAFTPRSSAAAPPPWRSAAFAKRLLSAALQWPPATAVRAIELVAELVERATAAHAAATDRLASAITALEAQRETDKAALVEEVVDAPDV